MVKYKKIDLKDALKELRTDLITADSTRAAGNNDKTPPHELLTAAITREVTKELKAIAVSPDRVDDLKKRVLTRWNDYITFAFDPKNSTAEFFSAHEQNIKDVIDRCQKGTLKGLDRQLIWRYKQTPPEIEVAGSAEKVPNPLAAAYQDMAIAHNAAFIMGTIGKALASPNIKTDLDAADFAADAIETMKHKMIAYDPCQAAVSTYMTNPIKWGILKSLSGNAQGKFDKRMRQGFESADEECSGIEPVARSDRGAMEGLAFADEQGGEAIIQRLRAAGAKLTGDRAPKIFAYKIDHPTATLEEVGNACGCTRENVRQGLAIAGAQIGRIDPELARYALAIINKNEDEMDHERLTLDYEPSHLQQEVKRLLEVVNAELAVMKGKIGNENIMERGGELKVSRGALRGRSDLKEAAADLTATYNAAKILENIAASPFVDAGFDVISLGQLRELAFYTGSSTALQTFVEDHIEEMAQAGRKSVIADPKYTTDRLDKVQKVVDRFYEATADTLPKFPKSDINALFTAPSSSAGEVLDKDDLLIVRQMGVAAVKGEQLSIRF